MHTISIRRLTTSYSVYGSSRGNVMMALVVVDRVLEGAGAGGVGGFVV